MNIAPTFIDFCRTCRKIFAAALLLAAPDALAYGVVGGSDHAQGGQDVFVFAATNHISYAAAEQEYLQKCRDKMREDSLCVVGHGFTQRILNQSAAAAYWNGTAENPGTRSFSVVPFEPDDPYTVKFRKYIACSQVRPFKYKECDETIYVTDRTECPAGQKPGPESCE